MKSQQPSENSCAKPPQQTCCGPKTHDHDWPSKIADESWIVGSIDTPAGAVPTISTVLQCNDRLGAWKARWGIGRMRYAVGPGLYAVGKPIADSPVLVSANYKMSFDRLRSALAGIDAWILVLDTKGINVWCAAGKGTFGTDELVQRTAATRLSEVVSHKRLIVPQLGAPGVAAADVRQRTGFRVVYGPIRAEDIPTFLQNKMKATPQMRLVEFPFWQRLAVAPVELVMSAKYVLIVMLALLLLAGLGPDGYRLARVATAGVCSALLFAAAVFVGTILTPALLPWLPGRALSVKGLCVGIALLLGIALWARTTGHEPQSWATVAAWCLIVPVTTSFTAMNFTGSTNYTSLSGVRREMRRAVPIQIAAATVGFILWIVGRFV